MSQDMRMTTTEKQIEILARNTLLVLHVRRGSVGAQHAQAVGELLTVYWNRTVR